MKIRMLTIKAGPTGAAQPGDVLSVPEAVSKGEAEALIKGGFAVVVEERPEKETAAAAGARETTSKPPAEPGKGKESGRGKRGSKQGAAEKE